MKEHKRLKDPIYGYISIPTQYMNGIIDTACFQRLRRIIQTSYSPLYSSAVHNRFVHSMGALTVVKTDSGYELAYYKNAISVIENVVYAHDAERKWIQSHPIVIYETYILQHIIGHLCKQVKALGKNLFCLESLLAEGQEFSLEEGQRKNLESG